MIVYDWLGPVQPLAVALTLKVPEIGAQVVFVAVKEETLPIPFPAKPIAVFEFVQL